MCVLELPRCVGDGNAIGDDSWATLLTDFDFKVEIFLLSPETSKGGGRANHVERGRTPGESELR